MVNIFEKFNSRNLFSANKIIKGSAAEIYAIIIDIHDYYCRLYIPNKTKEQKRINKINSLDFPQKDEDAKYNHNYNEYITKNEENLKIFQNNELFKKANLLSKINNEKQSNNNNNYNYNNYCIVETPKEALQNLTSRKNNNQNNKNNNNYSSNSNKKNKKSDYYSVNSFDFINKLFDVEVEIKDKM